MRAIQELYGNNGYFDARVTDGTRRVDDNKIDLVFTIQEGPQYSVGGVNVAGNKLYETADLIPVFQLETGATFSLADMKADLDTIGDYCSRGYAESGDPCASIKTARLFITYAIDRRQSVQSGPASASPEPTARCVDPPRTGHR